MGARPVRVVSRGKILRGCVGGRSTGVHESIRPVRACVRAGARQELEKLREGVDPGGERWSGRPTIGEELQHVMDRFSAMQPTGANIVTVLALL